MSFLLRCTVANFHELCAMSFEQAIEATKLEGNSRGRLFFSRWEDAQYLVKFEKYYDETKDPSIIPEAIYLCALNDFSIPEWCAMAYLSAVRKVKFYQAKSWDDVFGQPHPKGTHLGAKRQIREKQFIVYDRITKLKDADPNIPIDGYLFEKIGRELGIGSKTLTEEYYYSAKKMIEKQNPAVEALLKDYVLKTD